MPSFMKDLLQAVKSYATDEFVAGMLGQYFKKRTFAELLTAAEAGKGWEAISPTIKLRIVRMAQAQPQALASITYDNIVQWLQQANPDTTKALFSNRVTSQWIGKLWREFCEMRSTVSALPSENTPEDTP